MGIRLKTVRISELAISFLVTKCIPGMTHIGLNEINRHRAEPYALSQHQSRNYLL